MHHISFVSAPYSFRFCRIYAIIAIKNNFVIHIHSLGPSGSVENLGLRPRFSTLSSGSSECYALGFQHSPRDLANVNEWKNIFDPYNIICNLQLSSCGILNSRRIVMMMSY